MSLYIYKILITGAIIVLVTEIAKFNIKLAAIITAMPITTILIILWLYYEKMPNNDIASYIKTTAIFILPSLPIFIFFPFLIGKLGFFYTFFISITATIFFILVTNYFFNYLNLDLWKILSRDRKKEIRKKINKLLAFVNRVSYRKDYKNSLV